MNLPSFIAGRITFKSQRSFSKLSVRIAILGIMLGLGVMIISVAIVKGFKGEITSKIRGFAGDIIINKFDLNTSQENSKIHLTADTLQNLQHLRGVELVQPYASKPGIINVNNEVEGVVLKGVDKNYNWQYFKSIMVNGRAINFSDPEKSKQEILISQYTANRLKLKTGDDFLMYFVQQPLRKRKFTIVGIYDLGVEDVDRMYVIGDLSLIQRLNNWQDNEVGGYEIRIHDFNKLEKVSASVADNLPFNIKSYPVTEYYPTIFQWLSLLDVNTQVILVLMLAVAVINMISALLIIILERTNMIGILKALGSSNWKIRQIFLYNAAYLISLGMILGNALGLGFCLLQAKTHLFKLDEASYYMNFVPVELDLTDVLLLNIGTLIFCMLALLLPSVLVSRISPVKAIAFK
ncbi:FtsX-like permease family protein [Pedobacter sp. HMF7647]|uniref:FtsX-like permease family protein n=1 Tax=Hufsiella arboris TaxID=2695275 RepID=A0A7K1YE17_9SPHI|nr:ABC transporter permease [Hufsiella arboris]MXV52847.1 FtsX-like permease family protein [Hufsiella arboris]